MYITYYMQITSISASDLAKNVSDILNRVAYENTPVLILRHGKPIVKMLPAQTSDRFHQSPLETLDRFFGAALDFPSVRTRRRFRRRIASL